MMTRYHYEHQTCFISITNIDKMLYIAALANWIACYNTLDTPLLEDQNALQCCAC